MSLQSQLERARLRGQQRRMRARRAAGVPIGNAEQLEQIGAALFARDFLNDLDAMLIARGASLWVIWHGNVAQAYAETAEGIEVIIATGKRQQAVVPNFGGEIGSRMFVLMQQHNISVAVAFSGGLFVLRAGNTDVSINHCLQLAACTKGQKQRYCNEAELAANNSEGHHV